MISQTDERIKYKIQMRGNTGHLKTTTVKGSFILLTFAAKNHFLKNLTQI
ncbi:hypothetical protein LJX78_07255 [Methanimicrococcus blatticola]|nr:hypothetical protein [Methanimicrococcus blatticola]MBZ3936002.1 hypothetical protein [Methanimicrococcus blatticola]MCC2509385.1 hypothetical protein [Methanimicrococcus blatticola]